MTNKRNKSQLVSNQTDSGSHPVAGQSMQLSQADRLIEMAISNNSDMDKLEKLLDLKKRYEDEEARKAYTAAMSDFKAEGLVITKDRKVEFGHKAGDGMTSYSHATLGNIIGLATPLMAKHGLSHKWESKREGDRIEVRCVVTHKSGHSEATEWWPGPLDNSGKKNPIQQAASTVTYLERYTFLMITGLAVKDQDDDGQLSGDPEPESVKFITEEQANEIHAKIMDNELNMNIVKSWMRTKLGTTAIEDIRADQYNLIMGQLDHSIKIKKESETNAEKAS